MWVWCTTTLSSLWTPHHRNRTDDLPRNIRNCWSIIQHRIITSVQGVQRNTTVRWMCVSTGRVLCFCHSDDRLVRIHTSVTFFFSSSAEDVYNPKSTFLWKGWLVLWETDGCPFLIDAHGEAADHIVAPLGSAIFFTYILPWFFFFFSSIG